MRRAFFFIGALLFATSSFASIPRARATADASALRIASAETRVWAFDVLVPFEQPRESGLTRALRQAYERSCTTNASGSVCFLSVDPVIPPGAMRKPQLWNRYSYVGNNPMNRVDPDGRLLQLSGCTQNANSDACKAQYNLYLSTFGKQSQDAAKYLQIGKNGIIGFKGISGSAFAAKFGTMGRASNFLISNRAATFSITTDPSRVAPNSGGASTRYGNVGAEIAVDPGQFPNPQGGISQTATGALAHELGHALGTLLPGIRDAFDAQLGHTVWTMHEGYGTAFENQWRREQGLEQRPFYHYSPGDVGNTSDDVFGWPPP